MKKRPNLLNFVYLAGSGLAIQLAGTFYRIWLARRIGPEGLGILQMVYPVYRLLSGMSAMGLPLALTKWVSEYVSAGDYRRIQSLRETSVRAVGLAALVFMVLLFLTAPLLTRHVFTDYRVMEALFIIAPAIPFSALSAIYRGYFQGFSKMAPTAASEVFEQVVEIGTTALLVGALASLAPASINSYPVLGLTMGEVACLGTLLVIYKLRAPRPGNTLDAAELEAVDLPRSSIMRFAGPLLLNQIVTSVSMAAEAVIIPHFLIQSGYSVFESTGLFGKLTGMAEPISYFPLIFLAPLASVLSPQISAFWKNRDYQRIGRKLIRYYTVGILLCLAGLVLIMAGAGFLSQWLYNDPSPVRLIRLSVIALPFTGIAALNLTVLTALGATDRILLLSLWAVGLKTALLMVLTAMLGIEGAAWAITIAQIFLMLASLAELRQVLPASVRQIFPRSPRPFRFLRQPL